MTCVVQQDITHEQTELSKASTPTTPTTLTSQITVTTSTLLTIDLPLPHYLYTNNVA